MYTSVVVSAGLFTKICDELDFAFKAGELDSELEAGFEVDEDFGGLPRLGLEAITASSRR